MWSYDKRLQFPVKIKNPDPQTAKIVITQLGGPDGELGASMRYLNQRYAMPYKECKAILTDIGTAGSYRPLYGEYPFLRYALQPERRRSIRPDLHSVQQGAVKGVAAARLSPQGRAQPLRRLLQTGRRRGLCLQAREPPVILLRQPAQLGLGNRPLQKSVQGAQPFPPQFFGLLPPSFRVPRAAGLHRGCDRPGRCLHRRVPIEYEAFHSLPQHEPRRRFRQAPADAARVLPAAHGPAAHPAPV